MAGIHEDKSGSKLWFIFKSSKTYSMGKFVNFSKNNSNMKLLELWYMYFFLKSSFPFLNIVYEMPKCTLSFSYSVNVFIYMSLNKAHRHPKPRR